MSEDEEAGGDRRFTSQVQNPCLCSCGNECKSLPIEGIKARGGDSSALVEADDGQVKRAERRFRRTRLDLVRMGDERILARRSCCLA
jgi:hypothetical protein